MRDLGWRLEITGGGISCGGGKHQNPSLASREIATFTMISSPKCYILCFKKTVIKVFILTDNTTPCSNCDHSI